MPGRWNERLACEAGWCPIDVVYPVTNHKLCAQSLAESLTLQTEKSSLHQKTGHNQNL